jgi:hypothetical protein
VFEPLGDCIEFGGDVERSGEYTGDLAIYAGDLLSGEYNGDIIGDTLEYVGEYNGDAANVGDINGDIYAGDILLYGDAC